MERNIWLRRPRTKNPCVRGQWVRQSLYELGFSAALETCTTNTQSFAGIWVKLFQSFLASPTELTWLDNGPGIGRDAKVAYSGLFGRYLARAHLMFRENVQVLVPLEIARKELQKNNVFRIGDKPGSNGLEPDWIGLDDKGLVIAEAKGSFNRAVSPWKGHKTVPPLLRGAMNQAKRTKVYENTMKKPLPARYWAVASRWANEDNGVEPTTIAWGKGGGKRKKSDYREIASLLLRVELNNLLTGLGHPEIGDIKREGTGSSVRSVGDRHLMIGEQLIGPGFMTVVGLNGNIPLRSEDDVDRFLFIRDFLGDTVPYMALISLSSRYINKILRNQSEEILELPSRVEINEIEEGLCIVKFAGLSVAWFSSEIRVRFVE